MARSILIVDDEPLMLETIQYFLENAGLEVFSATSAEAALEILKKRSFHVMTLDLQMPGMSGLELCRMIRKDNQISWLICLTGYRSLFDISECREAGFDDYHVKPPDFPLLVDNIIKAFERIERWKKT